MKQKELELKRNLAQEYYMKGETQAVIAEKVGVSIATICSWVKKYSWATKRAVNTITRKELANKILLSIDKILEGYINSDDPNASINADKLCKMSKTIENIDKQTNIVNVVDVFIAFAKWLQFRQAIDPELTAGLIKQINHYQDLYIKEHLTNTPQ
jgi:DNA-binding XRE family transcriptional regulator